MIFGLIFGCCDMIFGFVSSWSVCVGASASTPFSAVFYRLASSLPLSSFSSFSLRTQNSSVLQVQLLQMWSFTRV